MERNGIQRNGKERKYRNMTISAVSVFLIGSLIIIASGLTDIAPPAQQTGDPGFVYTVEYECGTALSTATPQLVQPGNYTTNILVHNPFASNATTFIKVLPATGLPANLLGLPTSVWLTPFTNQSRTIVPNGALEIDCVQITGSTAKVPFSKGLVIISHPVDIGDGVLIKQPVFFDESLDVIASYTYLASQEQACFNKVVVKVKTLDEETGEVTFTIHELIIECKTDGTVVQNLQTTVAQQLTPIIGPVGPGTNKVVEIIEIDFGLAGGLGSSKDVEIIKGKFVPFIPQPPAPPLIP